MATSEIFLHYTHKWAEGGVGGVVDKRNFFFTTHKGAEGGVGGVVDKRNFHPVPTSGRRVVWEGW